MEHQDFHHFIEQLEKNFLVLNVNQKKKTLEHLFSVCSNAQLNFIQAFAKSISYDFIQCLPPEVCEIILLHLSSEDLLNCCIVSKNWNRFISSNYRIWEKRCNEIGVNLISESVLCKHPKSTCADALKKLKSLKNDCCLRVQERYNNRKINAMCITPHSSKLIVAFKKEAEIWNYENDFVERVKPLRANVSKMVCNDFVVFMAFHNGNITSWNINSGLDLYRISGHTALVLSLDFHFGLNIIVSGGYDSQIQVSRLCDSRDSYLGSFRRHDAPIFDVKLSHPEICKDQETETETKTFKVISSDRRTICITDNTIYRHKLTSTVYSTIDLKTSNVVPGLHVIDHYLCYATRETNNKTLFHKWCFNLKTDVENHSTDDPIVNLMAFGSKFLVYFTDWCKSTPPSFKIVDCNFETIYNKQCFSERPLNPNPALMYLQETSLWDGITSEIMYDGDRRINQNIVWFRATLDSCISLQWIR